MIVGVDGNEANVKKLVGVSTYTFQLLKRFKKYSSKNLQFRIFLKQQPLNHLPKESKYFKYVVKNGPLWSQTILPLMLLKNKLSKEKLDVFFSPAHYSPRLCPFPLVVTIHDLAYEYFPKEFLKKDLYKLKNWTLYSVKKAKKIIAVSKYTKKDIMKVYKIPKEKIKVIYNGWEEKRIIPKKPKINVTPRSYFLFVSTLQPRKNIKRLAEAFSKFKTQTPNNLKLVIAGKKGWLYEEIFKFVEKLPAKKDIIFTDYLPENNLAWLYKNALAFIHPSLYEGFGLPILEAFYYEVPVISSFTSSLSEVGGDACLYFDPYNVEEIKDKMIKIVKSENLRKELVKKGKERLKLFSWDKCAKKTLEVLKSAAKND